MSNHQSGVPVQGHADALSALARLSVNSGGSMPTNVEFDPAMLAALQALSQGNFHSFANTPSGSNGRMPNASSNGQNEIHDDDIEEGEGAYDEEYDDEDGEEEDEEEEYVPEEENEGSSGSNLHQNYSPAAPNQQSNVNGNMNNSDQALPAEQQISYTTQSGTMQNAAQSSFHAAIASLLQQQEQVYNANLNRVSPNQNQRINNNCEENGVVNVDHFKSEKRDQRATMAAKVPRPRPKHLPKKSLSPQIHYIQAVQAVQIVEATNRPQTNFNPLKQLKKTRERFVNLFRKKKNKSDPGLSVSSDTSLDVSGSIGTCGFSRPNEWSTSNSTLDAVGVQTFGSPQSTPGSKSSIVLATSVNLQGTGATKKTRPTQGISDTRNKRISSPKSNMGNDSTLMHQFDLCFPSAFRSIKLMKLNIEGVKEMLKQVDRFENVLDYLYKIVEERSIDGLTLSFGDLEDIEDMLSLSRSHWYLLRLLIQGLRRIQEIEIREGKIDAIKEEEEPEIST
ncbi:hypothetical protein Bhyg_02235 [Pseudolycoriella hygida]|uniref:Kinase D-interacting substrate of 220 kDa-like SAM domain-containing protein n=1 Tax=Pseudolycoriella hygida TaxID=35572 RepID=A0A9Q0S6B7_9DIPT|nr:hypothetical protein Bhyg_02235 [Pseudolycoriella hygida]